MQSDRLVVPTCLHGLDTLLEVFCRAGSQRVHGSSQRVALWRFLATVSLKQFKVRPGIGFQALVTV